MKIRSAMKAGLPNSGKAQIKDCYAGIDTTYRREIKDEIIK
jgi:hypothetical protein